MDAIEAMDWGAYANFGFTVNNYPEILGLFTGAYYLSTRLATAGIALLAAAIFLARRQPRSAAVAVVCFALAAAAIEAMHVIVPRRRPEDAAKFLGNADMLGSYPSAGVMLFLVSICLLSYALWHLAPRRWMRIAIVVIATLLTLWVCVSHLYLRIHFVTDVIGALAGGGVFSWLAYRGIAASKFSIGTATAAAPQ